MWGMSNAVFEKGAEVAEGWKKIVEGKRRFSDTLEMVSVVVFPKWRMTHSHARIELTLFVVVG